MVERRGALVLSIDFELYWGVRDKFALEQYADHLHGVRTAIPGMLDLFETYGVHATWATVGFLFFTSKEELLQGLPLDKPRYENEHLSPYEALADLGAGEAEDPFHFAPSLIAQIAAIPYQRIGTHTFSHYYCLAPGQDEQSFRADLEAAMKLGARWGLPIRSLIFPRNQVNPSYLTVCADMGITCYRGNPSSWLFAASGDDREPWLKRILRLVDHYVNLSGHNGHRWEETEQSYPLNIPASRFLRPVSKKLRWLERLRLQRILSSMTHAAKHGLVYHLWWHPHNFGADVEENLHVLQQILAHFQKLQVLYGMQSYSMESMAEELLEQFAQKGVSVRENSFIRS